MEKFETQKNQTEGTLDTASLPEIPGHILIDGKYYLDIEGLGQHLKHISMSTSALRMVNLEEDLKQNALDDKSPDRKLE